jgi:hypothetical protein
MKKMITMEEDDHKEGDDQDQEKYDYHGRGQTRPKRGE